MLLAYTKLMFLVWLIALLISFQILIRVWLKIFPQPIPYGWSWLLENPWRQSYRNPISIAKRCEIQTSDVVLEIGCGSGLFTPYLAAAAQKLIAQDLDSRYVSETKVKTSGLSNVEFLVSDALKLELSDSSMDVIVLISVLPEIPKPVLALQECVRVLKLGGRLVISQELFEPEYVTSSTTDAWALEAGLKPVKKTGNAWVYFNHYQKA